jgi:hypothetical protein
MASLQTSDFLWRDQSISHRRTQTPRDLRFRYGYICRLIDDDELRSLPGYLRSRTRSVHKAAYWKSLSLLRRDAEYVLRVRREQMSALKEWDFQTLLNDYSRIQMLLAKLTVAGLSHSVRLGAGLDAARQALHEVEAFLSAAPSLVPSLHAMSA